MNPTEDKPKTPEVVAPEQQLTAPTKEPKDPATLTYFRGVAPDHLFNQMYGFARAICGARFIPPAIRGDEASVFYVIAMSQDLGIQWTHGLRSLAPITKRGRDGDPDQVRPTIQGDIIMALLQKHKFLVKIKESTDEGCTVWMERPDKTMEFEASFTYAEAVKLGLTSKPNWNYRSDMCRWRAIARVARVVAADIMGGLHLPEELEEMPEERGDASNAAFAEQGRRNSEAENPFTVTAKAPVEQPAAEQAAESAKAEVPETPKAEAPPEQPKPEPKLTGKKAATKAFQDQQAKQQEKQPYVATDADVPSNIGTPKPGPMLMPPGTGTTRVERAGQIENAIAALVKRDNVAVRKAMADYFRAWFKGPLPKVSVEEGYEIPIRFLQQVAKDEKLSQGLMQDPINTGVAAFAGWEKLRRYMGENEWSNDLAKIATDVAVERFPDDGGESLIDYLESMVHPEGPMADSEVEAFLKMYRHSLHALSLMKAIYKNGKTLVWSLSEFEFNKVTEGDILSYIAGTEPAKPVQPGRDATEWEDEPAQ